MGQTALFALEDRYAGTVWFSGQLRSRKSGKGQFSAVEDTATLFQMSAEGSTGAR